jgi:hypothetical protein
MATLDVFQQLAQAPVGDHRVLSAFPAWHFWKKPERTGWLIVEKSGVDTVDVLWMTHRRTHQPHQPFGPAWSLTLDASGRVRFYMESALSMHMIWSSMRGGDREMDRACRMAEWAQNKLTQGGTVLAPN